MTDARRRDGIGNGRLMAAVGLVVMVVAYLGGLLGIALLRLR